MIVIKLDKNLNLDKALKIYKSKVIKTKLISEINNKKEFIKNSTKKRQELLKAKYVQKKYK